MFSQVLSVSLFLPGSLWCKCGILNVIPEVSYAVSFLFFVFFIFPMFYFSAVISILSSRSLIHSSASVCYWIFLVYHSPLFCLFVCFVLLLFMFFSSYRSLVNIFPIVFLRSWIIFTNNILSSFSGRLCVSTLFRFSGVLSCPFIWDITLCFSIVINLL